MEFMDILQTVADNKAAVVGFVSVICEVVVIVVNTRRRLQSLNKKVKALAIEAWPEAEQKNAEWLRILLWSANPINLFKKSD